MQRVDFTGHRFMLTSCSLHAQFMLEDHTDDGTDDGDSSPNSVNGATAKRFRESDPKVMYPISKSDAIIDEDPAVPD